MMKARLRENGPPQQDATLNLALIFCDTNVMKSVLVAAKVQSASPQSTFSRQDTVLPYITFTQKREVKHGKI